MSTEDAVPSPREFHMPRTMTEAREMKAHWRAAVQNIENQLDPQEGRQDDGSPDFARWRSSAKKALSCYREEIEKIDAWVLEHQDGDLIKVLDVTRLLLIELADNGVQLGVRGYDMIGELKRHRERLAEMYGMPSSPV